MTWVNHVEIAYNGLYGQLCLRSNRRTKRIVRIGQASPGTTVVCRLIGARTGDEVFQQTFSTFFHPCCLSIITL